jgi:hypothetical protein
MAQPRQQLTWIAGGKAPRAPAIPEEKWMEHKDALIALRESMTLESVLDVITANSAKYGFTPT